jgi:tetratricopeptide (TPR) repeat protein
LALSAPEEASGAGPMEFAQPEEALEAALEEHPMGESQVETKEEHAPALEDALAETMDLSDFGELSGPAAELFSEAPTEPGVPVQEAEEHPFEGRITDEPSSESLPSSPVEFGEAVEIAERVAEAPVAGPKAEDLEFPAERSLDDALDAAFQEDEAPAEESQKVQASQELFEEEDDFFDLAAELEEGFLNVQNAVEEERPADGQNYSIEEILTDFKKGVEKQLGAEDYDTRYNLGIAYKEMGLVDEAIAEFQIAAKDEKRFLECCSMLGLCFLEKGMPKLALKWYQRGLDTKGYSEEEYLGLRFEMGAAYEATGEEDKALECYQDVYGANANYRNVSKKIKELQQQLKKK